MNVTIDKEFRTLIPPLSEEEFNLLESNCIENGIQDSLKTWNGILIDGHNRYEIAQKHGLEFETEEMEFSGRTDAKLWIIKNQLGRRNLSAYDRSVLALKLKPLIADAAKARMILAPQKSAEREKKIKNILDSYDYDVAKNLVAMERANFAKEDRRESIAEEKYIYFARFDGDKLKIGSSYDPEARVRQLSVSCPNIKIVEVVHFGKGSEKHERAIGKKFSKYKIGNECYQCSDDVLSQMIAFTKKERTRKDSTAEIISQVAGVSHDTIHKVETIEKSGDSELIDKVKKKEMSINKAYRQVKGTSEKKASLPQTEVRDVEITVTNEDVMKNPVQAKKVEIEANIINKPVEEEPLPFEEITEDVSEELAHTFDVFDAAPVAELGRVFETLLDLKENEDSLIDGIKKSKTGSEKEEFRKQLADCGKFLAHIETMLIGW